MNYNENSGKGRLGVQALYNLRPTIGKVFIVGDSSTVDLQRLEQVFGFDPEGELHYFSTIEAAINSGAVEADRNDVVLVAPGHSETFTGTDLTLDIAGVTILGLGKGSLQPQIKFNHADAEISVAADNVTIENLRLTSTITVVKVAIEIEDGIDYATVRGCRFDVETTGTDEFLVSIRTNDASNFALIEGNDIQMGLGGAVAGVSFTKDTDGTIVRNNTITGDYSTANIEGLTTLSTNLVIEDNLLVNGLTGAVGTEPGIQLLTGSTGIVRKNDIACNLTHKALAIVGDAVMMFENYYCETVAETGGLIGTASADD